MMQEKHLYEYAVIRYVPRIEREEFINIGLVMMCKRRRWIRLGLDINATRINAIAPGTDIDTIERQLKSFCDIARGYPTAGPIAMLEPEERFRWLTAVKSAMLQTSRPHPGHCTDLEATFDRLMAELVSEPAP